MNRHKCADRIRGAGFSANPGPLSLVLAPCQNGRDCRREPCDESPRWRVVFVCERSRADANRSGRATTRKSCRLLDNLIKVVCRDERSQTNRCRTARRTPRRHALGVDRRPAGALRRGHRRDGRGNRLSASSAVRSQKRARFLEPAQCQRGLDAGAGRTGHRRFQRLARLVYLCARQMGRRSE